MLAELYLREFGEHVVTHTTLTTCRHHLCAAFGVVLVMHHKYNQLRVLIIQFGCDLLEGLLQADCKYALLG